MALVPANSQAVVSVDDGVFKTPPIPKKRKKIMEEESYSKELEKIIERDFYPDIGKLRAQNEYLDAEARNDAVKMRELQIRYRPTPKRRPGTDASDVSSNMRTPSTFSPATFETPASPLPRGDKNLNDQVVDREPVVIKVEESAPSPPKEVVEEKAYGLDDFLARVTSEDNASFEDIMEESNQKHRLRYPWLYENDPQKKKALSAAAPQGALPASGSPALAVEYERPNRVETWEYKARNAVMQIPEGIPFTPAEITERDEQKIVVDHPNTRFTDDPWKTFDVTVKDVSALPSGKIGPDGLEIGAATPKVNGYGFMASPSPMPGVGESPMMTWGEIEGTPFVLNASDTPIRHSTPGPQFKIPEIPDRDRVHLALVDTVTKRHRVKREEALQQVRSLAAAQTPKFGSALSAARVDNMSPAAKRLTNKLGIRASTDKHLTASYTPSPRRNPLTPSPSSSARTVQSPRTPSTPTITDNLLPTRKNLVAPK